MKIGSYVLGTKYSDGDPADGWAVGFFDGVLSKVNQDRFLVCDSDGNQFRGNGFRRVQHMPLDCGDEFIKIALSYDWPNWGEPGAVDLWAIFRDLKRSKGHLPAKSDKLCL